MKEISSAATLLVANLLLAPFGHAHHAAAAVYDRNQTQTIEGTVVSLELVNPHVRLFVDMTTESGDVERWIVEGAGKLSLGRRGWTEDMFEAGEAITAIGNPAASGAKAMWLQRIVMPDGREFMDPLLEDALAIEAERRERARRVLGQKDGE